LETTAREEGVFFLYRPNYRVLKPRKGALDHSSSEQEIYLPFAGEDFA
jgi:hypothetical protein